MVTKKEIKRLIDFKNYLNKCVSGGHKITNKTIKNYLNEDYFFKKI